LGREGRGIGRGDRVIGMGGGEKGGEMESRLMPKEGIAIVSLIVRYVLSGYKCGYDSLKASTSMMSALYCCNNESSRARMKQLTHSAIHT